jgi:phenylpropionate dioxygenase-like ring-hydroxylating dioxygenase large terminal subunit
MARSFEYEQPAINPAAPDDSLESRQPAIDNGVDVLDPSRYHSREFMAAEWQRLWPRVWLIAGVVSDVAEAGDYYQFDFGHEAFVMVRGEDARIRVFYNVCPHRGNRVVLNDRGSVGQFTCAFHSWQFGLDGCLKNITDEHTFRPELVAHRPGLTEVRSEIHAGIVFINMDGKAPPLKEWLGLPDGYLEAYQLDKMVPVRHTRSEWAANWKTGIDAFYEVYHLHAVHPQTSTVMDDLGTQIDLYPNGCSRMIVPLARKSPRAADQESVDEGLKYMIGEAGMAADEYAGDAKTVRLDIQHAKRERAKRLGLDYSRLSDGQLTDSWATGIFPNVQIGLHAEGAFLMRFIPHPTNPERFYYDTMTLFLPADDPNYRVPDWMGLPEGADTSGETRPDVEHIGIGEPANLGLVLDQDSELLPVVQKGIRSRGFRGAIWSEQEIRLRHFHRELDRYLNGEK